MQFVIPLRSPGKAKIDFGFNLYKDGVEQIDPGITIRQISSDGDYIVSNLPDGVVGEFWSLSWSVVDGGITSSSSFSWPSQAGTPTGIILPIREAGLTFISIGMKMYRGSSERSIENLQMEQLPSEDYWVSGLPQWEMGEPSWTLTWEYPSGFVHSYLWPSVFVVEGKPQPAPTTIPDPLFFPNQDHRYLIGNQRDLHWQSCARVKYWPPEAIPNDFLVIYGEKREDSEPDGNPYFIPTYVVLDPKRKEWTKYGIEEIRHLKLEYSRGVLEGGYWDAEQKLQIQYPAIQRGGVVLVEGEYYIVTETRKISYYGNSVDWSLLVAFGERMTFSSLDGEVGEGTKTPPPERIEEEDLF